MAYCTVAQVRELLQSTSATQDGLIETLCRRVADLIDGYTGRSFLPATKTLRLDGDGSPLLTLPLAPVRDITAVRVDGRALAADEYAWAEDGRLRLLGPGRYSARLRGDTSVFSEGFQNVEVAGTFGHAAVPGDVEQAAIIQVIRWLKAKDNAFADTTGSPDGGQLIFAKQLYPEVKGILDRYRIRVGGLAAI